MVPRIGFLVPGSRYEALIHSTYSESVVAGVSRVVQITSWETQSSLKSSNSMTQIFQGGSW